MTKQDIEKELRSDKFKEYVEKTISANAQYLLEDSPEDYDGVYDNNPYGLEPQLAIGSGGWEFPEWAYTDAEENAKEGLLLAIDEEYFRDFQAYKPLQDLFEGEYNESEADWLKAILTDVVEHL